MQHLHVESEFTPIRLPLEQLLFPLALRQPRGFKAHLARTWPHADERSGVGDGVPESSGAPASMTPASTRPASTRPVPASLTVVSASGPSEKAAPQPVQTNAIKSNDRSNENTETPNASEAPMLAGP